MEKDATPEETRKKSKLVFLLVILLGIHVLMNAPFMPAWFNEPIMSQDAMLLSLIPAGVYFVGMGIYFVVRWVCWCFDDPSGIKNQKDARIDLTEQG